MTFITSCDKILPGRKILPKYNQKDVNSVKSGYIGCSGKVTETIVNSGFYGFCRCSETKGIGYKFEVKKV